ncbi:MAG: hypothetical protein ACI9EF_001961 [Pseudohongiellaceae bacterium]|jgi:hypothetical protein
MQLKLPRSVRSLLLACAVALLASGCLRPRNSSRADWLVQTIDSRAQVIVDQRAGVLTLENGLVRRAFLIAPDGATVSLDNLMTGASLLRGVKPEARLTVDGQQLAVGGLLGQPDYAYLRPAWLDALVANPNALHLTGWKESETKAPFPWARVRHSEERPWPPPGRRLVLSYTAETTDNAGDLAGLTVDVVHELYDGMPLLAKWLVVRNGGERPVRLQSFTSEELALVEAASHVDSSSGWRLPEITVRSDYSFGGMGTDALERVAHWEADPDYTTQVNYARTAPVLLSVRPEIGPDVLLDPGEELTTFRTYLLVHDSTDRERQGLAERQMWRTLAPWITENPLMMHVRSADPAAVRLAIDQCAEVGFEMVILTFGSSFNIEDESAENIELWRTLGDYAEQRGIELGGYSLLASRAISPEDDVIDWQSGERGHARFGNSPCLGSAWGQHYFASLYDFIGATDFDLLEHDGSYPGDSCASTSHPGHEGFGDSQWTQWRTITEFYQWCRARGVYLNVPDSYMLAGSNKSGMGYRETNWSLPRAEQVLHGRQNIYDGTWTKPPSMGWMFVPLTEYHGGGEAATLEPLAEHLDAYEDHLANNLGAGVQACWRGPRLYDSDATQELVTRWVSWFKRHRQILESDVIHLRRADGRDIDMLLHVNPRLDERGLLAIWNPLDEDVITEVDVPLYYTGLDRKAHVSGWNGREFGVQLDREYVATIQVTVPAGGMAWYVFSVHQPAPLFINDGIGSYRYTRGSPLGSRDEGPSATVTGVQRR